MAQSIAQICASATRFLRIALVVWFGGYLSACNSQPIYEPPLLPPSSTTAMTKPAESKKPELARASDTNEVVLALVQQSQQQNQEGNTSRSISLLERALRIAPKDAGLWLELARRYLEKNRPEQAVQFARKAVSLGQDDPDLLNAADKIIADARSASSSVRG